MKDGKERRGYRGWSALARVKRFSRSLGGDFVVDPACDKMPLGRRNRCNAQQGDKTGKQTYELLHDQYLQVKVLT
jgi:hypothetical protein